jgi:hypothetical protein
VQHIIAQNNTQEQCYGVGESVGQLLHLGGNGQINELVANVHHEAAEDAGVHLLSWKGENELGMEGRKKGKKEDLGADLEDLTLLDKPSKRTLQRLEAGRIQNLRVRE